jgi:rare lipoprotein A
MERFFKSVLIGVLAGLLALPTAAQESTSDDVGTPAMGTTGEEAPLQPTPDGSRCALGDRSELCTGQQQAITEIGRASWYGPGFQGKRTASGERFDMNALTAAHKTLPFGTVLRVRSLDSGREVDVKVNDRGPFTADRAIDLSRAAANALGILRLGAKEVAMRIISPAEAQLSRPSTPAVDSPALATAPPQHLQNLRQRRLQRSLQGVRRIYQKHTARR